MKSDPLPFAKTDAKKSEPRTMLYVLPKREFFNEGRRGRVTHAMGIARGLVRAGTRLCVLSGPGTASTLASSPEPIRTEQVNAAPRLAWEACLLWRVTNFLQEQPTPCTVIIRYASSTGFLFIPLFWIFRKTTWCFEVNSLIAQNRPELPRPLRWLSHFLETKVLARADILTVVSEGLAKFLRNANSTKNSRILVVPNGANPCDDHPHPVGPKENRLSFAYFGMFQPYYDLNLLIKTIGGLAKDDSRVRLDLFGTGELEDGLREVARSYPTVRFHGRFKLESLLANGSINSATTLILPGSPGPLSDIGSPTKLYEYMSLGLPIIAAAVGQPGAILEDQKTALLYEPGNAEALRNAVNKLIRDPQLARRLGERVREEFLLHHTWDSRGRSLLDGINARNPP